MTYVTGRALIDIETDVQVVPGVVEVELFVIITTFRKLLANTTYGGVVPQA
jgi:hypothetical protein